MSFSHYIRVYSCYFLAGSKRESVIGQMKLFNNRKSRSCDQVRLNGLIKTLENEKEKEKEEEDRQRCNEESMVEKGENDVEEEEEEEEADVLTSLLGHRLHHHESRNDSRGNGNEEVDVDDDNDEKRKNGNGIGRDNKRRNGGGNDVDTVKDQLDQRPGLGGGSPLIVNYPHTRCISLSNIPLSYCYSYFYISLLLQYCL